MRGSKRTAEELDLELVKHPSKEDPFAKVNKDGYYLCTSCGNALYSSEDKFSSDSKFPAFRKGLPKALKYKYDYTYGMKRTEIICGTCEGHVGHIYRDAKMAGDRDPNAKNRHCVTTGAIKFVEELPKTEQQGPEADTPQEHTKYDVLRSGALFLLPAAIFGATVMMKAGR